MILESFNISIMYYKEIVTLKRAMTMDIEIMIIIKFSNKYKHRQIASLVNFIKHIKKNECQSFSNHS